MSKNSLEAKRKFILIGVIALSLISFQVSLKATGSVKNDYTDSSSLGKETGKDLYHCSYFYQVAQEKEPEIEYWMLNPDDPFWQENETVLETWMYDIHSTFWQEILVNDKEEYEIEDWMMNPKDWSINKTMMAGITR